MGFMSRDSHFTLHTASVLIRRVQKFDTLSVYSWHYAGGMRDVMKQDFTHLHLLLYHWDEILEGWLYLRGEFE